MHQPQQNEARRPSRNHWYARPAESPSAPPASLPESGELVLIRGLPGSGKSTMAREMVADGFVHFEADMFFTVDGVYAYDPARIQDAQDWCQRMTRQALRDGQRVVVSNTFTRLQEMTPYRGMVNEIRVVEALGRWQNTHGVPAEMVDRMAQRWERLPA